ncbi:MAG: hypothetical protein HON90_03570 [Halobacteriovoraceae bacterium]|jgi:pilus assembly protein CpaC|nr:hypothetical protein [Halobacteriovoraceae bacterium]
MKNLILLILLFSFSVNAQKIIRAKEKKLEIAIGIDELVKFDYKFNPKIPVGNESVLEIYSLNTSKKEITLRGIKAGKTSVTVSNVATGEKQKIIVTVTSNGNSNIVRELRELIGDIEGINIKIQGGKVVVDGEIVVPNKIGKILTVLSKYPDVLLLIEYSKQTQTLVAREMQEAINRNNMKDVTVTVVNGDYWLEGVVNSDGKKTLAENVAQAYLPDTLSGLGASAGGGRFKGKVKGLVANFINVNVKKDPEPPPKLIKVSAQFVELSKDYLKTFGFKWAPFMTNESEISFGKKEDGGISTKENNTLSGTISRLFPKLTSAKEAGYARVIQSGMVVTNNAKPIIIKKSSKLNFAVGTGDGQEAKSVDISFNMSTQPSIKNEENVELKDLFISVSLPNRTGSDGSPQVTTNEVRTNLTVKSKESAVIGGIVQSNSSTDYDKLDPDPVKASEAEGTVQSAPLFQLLRSKSYTTAKSQFVVFITPEILESASKGTSEIRRKFRKRER